MSKYVWQHAIEGEADRLRMMSDLLDADSRYHLARLSLPEECHSLEIGAGNGSLSQWIAAELTPGGHVIATDVAPELMDGIETANLEVRALDVVEDGLPQNGYDLVLLRALLHHLPTRMNVIEAMAKALKPGGWVFIQEPDFYPTIVAEPSEAADFWRAFLDWSKTRDIDYFIGRKVAPKFQQLGLRNISAVGHTHLYTGGSLFARWWQLSLEVAADTMLREGAVTRDQLDRFMALYDDEEHWTMTIAFTVTCAQRAGE